MSLFTMCIADVSVLREVKEVISCTWCSNIFENPKQLPCSHIFCSDCLIEQIIQSTTEIDVITCPECSKKEEIPNDIDDFPSPPHITQLIEIYQRDEIKSADTKAAAPQPATCKVHGHESQSLDLYCETCQQLVCESCIATTCIPNNHKQDSIQNMVHYYQTHFDEELKYGNELCEDTKEVLATLKIAEEDLQETRDARLQRVKTTFIALSNQLKKEEMFFIDSVLASFKEQQYINSIKIDTTSKILKDLKFLLESIQTSLKSELKPAMLIDLSNKKKKLAILKEKVAKSQSPDSAPLPEMEVELLKPEEFERYCHVKNFAYKKADSLRSHLERGFRLCNVPVKEVTDFALHLNPKEMGHFEKTSLSARLQCINSNSLLKVKIKQISREEYSLLMVPLERGKHELQIKYNDMHICGSPIPVHVTVQPDKLNHPLSSIRADVSGLSCFGGHIYASSAEREILVLDFTSRAIERSIPLTGVCEMVVDNDIIYATIGIGNKLVKVDMDGNQLQETGAEGANEGQFNEINGIQMSKDGEIYVCDTFNHRIQVFDKDLQRLRIIGKSGSADGCFNKPYDLDFDKDGNIYVADYDNQRIQVLTPSGKHIRNIKQSGTKRGELIKPVSVAIYRGMVYTVDSYNDRVSVFKTTGEFVTTFGADNLEKPEDIAIDDNGFIHISDGRNKIITF